MGHRWGVLALGDGELIVPDIPGSALIPISPGHCLACGHESATITGDEARALNQPVEARCHDHWFRRTSPHARLMRIASAWRALRDTARVAAR